MALNISAGISRFKVSDGNLGLLQEYLRRDPESYRDEFMEQYQHFQQFINILELEPKLHRSSVEQLLEVVGFLTGVAHCYAEEAKTLGQKLVELLFAKADDLGHELRMAFCRALIALRNAQRMCAMDVLPILFHLLKCDDKQLRKFIKSALLSIIKHTKIGSKTQRRKSRQRRRVAQLGGGSANGGAISLSAESSKIQAYIFAQLRDSCTTAARVAQNVLVLAYRKGFWRDAKTANVLAECVFHKLQRIQLSTMRFFLGSVEDEEGNGEGDSDSETEDKKDNAGVLRDAISSMHYAKKTKKRQKELERAKRDMGKSKRSKRERSSKFCNLEALNAIYDPQKFADRLFGCLESKRNEKFVVRLLQIALCARVIGIHRLQTLGFYSYLHRFLQPKQREVTRILLYAAQACHELVPPDVVQELVRRIAQNFITDQNTPEAITVGLNTIREVFSTCPAAATEELLRDLTMYKSYKNKNVSMAARSLITLFRSVNPQLLHHKDRGRPAADDGTGNTLSAVSIATDYGALKALDFVPGAEVLSEIAPAEEPKKAPSRKRKRGDRNSEDEDSEDEWMDVSSGDEDNDVESKNDVENDEKVEDGADESSGEWATDDDEEEDDSDDDDGWEECSTDEDDDDTEEVDEDDDENDDEEEEEESPKTPKKSVTFKLTKGEKKKAKAMEKEEAQRLAFEKAKLVSESRILTDSDFRAIRVHQIRRQMAAEKRSAAQKRQLTNDEARLDEEIQEKMARREEGGDGLPRLNDIEHFHKKIYRQNKAERLAQAEIDRDEVKQSRRPKKNGPHVGRTNRELAKHKNYQMVKQKVRGKNRQRSFRDRQISLRNYLQKQAGKKV